MILVLIGVYLIILIIFLAISGAAIFHYLKYRFPGDLSTLIISIFIIYSTLFILMPFFILDYGA